MTQVPHTLRTVLVGWTGHRANWGCQATSYGLLADLEDASAPDIQLQNTLVPLVGRNRRQRAWGRVFSPWLKAMILKPNPSPKAVAFFQKLVLALHGPEARALLGADLVFYTAEGNLDGLSFDGGLGMLLLPALANMKGIPVISLNQTIFLQNRDLEAAMVRVFSQFRLVSVREIPSKQYLEALKIQTHYWPDAAFHAEPCNSDIASLIDGPIRAPLLCLTGSALGVSSLNQPYVRVAAQIAKSRGLQICGLFWQKDAASIVQETCASVGGYQPVFVRPDVDYRGLTSILAQSVAVVGGRYHTALKAATVGTPFLLLPSGTHKSEGLVMLLDYPFAVRKFEDADGLASDLATLLDSRDELSGHLQAKMSQIAVQRAAGVGIVARELRQLVAAKAAPAPRSPIAG